MVFVRNVTDERAQVSAINSEQDPVAYADGASADGWNFDHPELLG